MTRCCYRPLTRIQGAASCGQRIRKPALQMLQTAYADSRCCFREPAPGANDLAAGLQTAYADSRCCFTESVPDQVIAPPVTDRLRGFKVLLPTPPKRALPASMPLQTAYADSRCCFSGGRWSHWNCGGVTDRLRGFKVLLHDKGKADGMKAAGYRPLTRIQGAASLPRPRWW